MLSKFLRSCLTRKEDADDDESFLCNGSILLEDLIASCDGKALPVRHYSAQELIRATNNFDPINLVEQDRWYKVFRGFLDHRPVIIKKMGYYREGAIRDIIISMQMSTHKNVLKLLGCCLEFPVPALVHENAAKGVLKNYTRDYGDNNNVPLPWKTRLCIAKQVANAITYLHTAFPRPIIHRDLRPSCIFLDNDFAPKLWDFSFSITIPAGQLHVEDDTVGETLGFLDPVYMSSNQITEKTDVYSFGVILLTLLTGQDAVSQNEHGEFLVSRMVSYRNSHASGDQFQLIVDPKILEELGEEDKEAKLQQLHDFLILAFSCTEEERDKRPDMIDVAKELVRIEKFIIPC